MTDYDAMTDEQLAVLVAERVMGWKRQRGGWHWLTTENVTLPVGDWLPASDWGDAGWALERMRDGGWDCLITIDGHMDGRSQRAIVHVSRAGSGGFGHADSPCRAICIAALRAVDA